MNMYYIFVCLLLHHALACILLCLHTSRKCQEVKANPFFTLLYSKVLEFWFQNICLSQGSQPSQKENILQVKVCGVVPISSVLLCSRCSGTLRNPRNWLEWESPEPRKNGGQAPNLHRVKSVIKTIESKNDKTRKDQSHQHNETPCQG